MIENTPLESMHNLADAEVMARERLPAMIYHYFAGAALDEITARENRLAWDEIALRPRILVNVADRRMETAVLGDRMAAPLIVAPMALQHMAHVEGEGATARAASTLGVPMTVSTFSTVAVEEVRECTSAPLWLQLYVFRDRGITRDLVERAAAAGCTALMLTVDTPVLGRRERDIRGGFTLPPGITMAHAMPYQRQRLPAVEGASGLQLHAEDVLDPSLDWSDLAWLASLTSLPILLKGIVRGDDARRAVEAGAAGVVVSNHGGRQLDGAVATARALREVVSAVEGRVPVLVDGGIRRGTDVLKALAMGASAAMVGRPVLWGLAVGGAAGVERVLRLLLDELDLAMALGGCRSLDDITADLL